MFGKNSIVGKKFFKEQSDKYLVTSIFYTIQGEGPLAGHPAVFIRLAKCNLACSFCDTYFDSGDWMTIPEIETKISDVLHKYYNGNIPYWVEDRSLVLVITGGEPMLQNLYPLLDYFGNIFNYTQIESNGVINQTIPFATTLVVSPKCAEKHGKTLDYIKPHDKILSRADALKFVISADPESKYHTIPYWAEKWKYDAVFKDIYISPMNVYLLEPRLTKIDKQNSGDIDYRSEVEEVISFWTPGLLDMNVNQKNHEYAADYCMQNGYKLNLQMHLYAGKA